MGARPFSGNLTGTQPTLGRALFRANNSLHVLKAYGAPLSESA
jgi:hypothetical protein